jgi:hypothetical protein
LPAIRPDSEDTGDGDLAGHVLVPIERTIREPSRHAPFHHGRNQVLDHLLINRKPLVRYRGLEIHDERLHDGAAASAIDRRSPHSEHAPVLAAFHFDN